MDNKTEKPLLLSTKTENRMLKNENLVKIIIERSFVPQVPFEKFSTVGRGVRPDRNEVYEVVVRFECAEVLFALWLSCYEI